MVAASVSLGDGDTEISVYITGDVKNFCTAVLV